MTETTLPPIAPASTPAPRPARRKRSARALLWLLLLVLVAAGGGCGWLWLDAQLTQRAQLEQRIAALEDETAQSALHQRELTQSTQHSAATLTDFTQRLDQYDQLAGKLADQVQGGRMRFQLAAAENLLLAANERAQLQHDAYGAALALTLADERLAALAEPRLYTLREAIAQERVALAAVPQADITSAALTLSSLIARAAQLPLHARVPQRVETQIDAVTWEPNAGWDTGWFGRLRANVAQALSSVFAVRRNDGPAPRLLTAEAEAQVYQTLALKLEGARVALLRRDAASFHDLCGSASDWLRDYFRADDPNVLAAQAELERLQATALDAPLPDITHSLALLRSYLETATQQ